MDDHYSNNEEKMDSTLMSCELPHVNSIGVTKPRRRKGVKKTKQVLKRRWLWYNSMIFTTVNYFDDYSFENITAFAYPLTLLFIHILFL